jgi:AcrR family transcriptional regulator
MGVRERRQREREELRRAILDTAREIAAAEGWSAVTIRRVAEKIEYSPPVIYEHFSSKEQIVVELMRRGFREMLEAMRAARDAHKDPVEALLAIGQAYWSFSVGHPEMHLGMHGETAFEACGVRPCVPGAKNGQDESHAGTPHHRPFEEVHDREELLRFFGSRSPEIPADEPFPETRQIFLTVRDAVERALGRRAGDLESLSWKVVTLWAATHGLVTLAMAGMIPNGRDAGADLVAKMGRDLLASWRAEITPWRPASPRATAARRGEAARRAPRGKSRAR